MTDVNKSFPLVSARTQGASQAYYGGPEGRLLPPSVDGVLRARLPDLRVFNVQHAVQERMGNVAGQCDSVRSDEVLNLFDLPRGRVVALAHLC